jgi:hypothetical protein
MLHGEIISHLDFSHPSTKAQSLIDHPIFLEIVKMRGAMYLGFLPLSQGASQKAVLHSLSMVMEVAA